MITQKTLTQNTTYYTAALVFQKVLAFVYFTFLARGLGVEDLGRYAFAFSFTSLFSVFVDVGLSSLLTREVAKDKTQVKNLLAHILGLKISLGIFAYILIVILINLLGYPSLTKQLVYLTGLIMLLDTFSTTFWATLRGNQNLKYESLGIILFESLVIGLGLIFLYLGLGVKWVVAATLLGSTFFFIFSWLQMRVRLKFKPVINFDKKIIKMLLKISYPFALMGIFARLNTQIDTIFLSKIGCAGGMCESNVGIYSIASKITLAIHFIPLAFIAALFPAMSEYFVTDQEKLKRIFEKAMRYLMIISTPIALGIFSLASQIVPKVFGAEYQESILPLQILMCSLVFLFLTFPIGSLLNATSHQLRNSVYVGLGVLVNIILNLILIPRFTYTGAAAASFASTLVILGLGLYIAPKIISFSKSYLIVSFIKSLAASIVMSLFLYQLLNKVHFLILIPLGAVVYFGVLFGIGGFSRSEVREMLLSLKLKKW